MVEERDLGDVASAGLLRLIHRCDEELRVHYGSATNPAFSVSRDSRYDARRLSGLAWPTS